MHSFVLGALFLTSGLLTTESASILFFFQMSANSHRLGVWPLVEELVRHGHSVTFHQIQPPRNLNPNVTEFFPKSMQEALAIQKKAGKAFSHDEIFRNRFELGKSWEAIPVLKFLYAPLVLCEMFLSAPETIEFANNTKFDLIVINALFNECAYGLAHKFGAKTILYSSTAPFGSYTTNMLGFLETDEISWDTELVYSKQLPNTFIQRVRNVLISSLFYFFRTWISYPRIDEMLRTKLNMPEMPSVAQLKEETQMFFYNSHFSEDTPRTLTPNFLQVGGMHCWQNKSKPLPKKMEEFVGGSGEDGFIYVSFGGQVDMGIAPMEFQNVFINAFAKSDIRFMWRRSGERMENMTDNVYTAEWMPQQELLRHPKCRAYIGHAGSYGIQEAVMSAVPMIVFPIFGDQFYNALRLEREGRGISLEISTVTAHTLAAAIQEVLRNQSYKKNMEALSRRFKDRETSPLETATFWTEYVLRNEKAFERPYARTTFWFQRLLLDVWAFIALIAAALLILAIYSIRRATRFLFAKRRTFKTKTQ